MTAYWSYAADFATPIGALVQHPIDAKLYAIPHDPAERTKVMIDDIGDEEGVVGTKVGVREGVEGRSEVTRPGVENAERFGGLCC